MILEKCFSQSKPMDKFTKKTSANFTQIENQFYSANKKRSLTIYAYKA